MAYEEFTAKQHRGSSEPKATITKYGVLNLNRTCYEKYFKDYKHAIFFFDKNAHKVGIRRTNSSADNAYPIRVNKKAGMASISAMAFLRYFGIGHDKTKSYSCTWDQKQKLLEIKLTKG